MKGLLLKDLYMMKSYCRSYLLFALFFRSVYKELHADRETGC